MLVSAALFAGVASATPPALAQNAPHCPPGQQPEFVHGFAFMKSQLGATMGEPLECEHTEAATGDAHQQTSTGLAFYRKSTNTPTFTTGWEHWGWTPDGLAYWTGDSIDPPPSAGRPPGAVLVLLHPTTPTPTPTAPTDEATPDESDDSSGGDTTGDLPDPDTGGDQPGPASTPGPLSFDLNGRWLDGGRETVVSHSGSSVTAQWIPEKTCEWYESTYVDRDGDGVDEVETTPYAEPYGGNFTATVSDQGNLFGTTKSCNFGTYDPGAGGVTDANIQLSVSMDGNTMEGHWIDDEGNARAITMTRIQ